MKTINVILRNTTDKELCDYKRKCLIVSKECYPII